LKNVPWDQALDLILKTKGLAMRKAGNVIMVAPAQEIAAQEKLELEANKQIGSEEHTYELQSHGHIQYAVFCLKKKKI